MTNEQREIITRMQHSGMGYRTIAAETGLPLNSVKSWCRRHPITSSDKEICMQCGAVLHMTPHHRKRKFCSDHCRALWWSAHPEHRQPKTIYKHICLCCGEEFTNSRITASYCSRACFARARMKVTSDG